MLVNKTSLANSTKDIIYSSNGICCMYAMDYFFHCVTFLFQPQLNRMAKEGVNTCKCEMLQLSTGV